MPIDEIRLGVAFSKLPDQPAVVRRLIDEVFDNENFHVRRIAINACHRSGHFDVPGLMNALTKKLEDPAGWVRYDAAWAIETAGYDTQEIRLALMALAHDIQLPEDEERIKQNLSDSTLQAKARARKTLDAIVQRGFREG